MAVSLSAVAALSPEGIQALEADLDSVLNYLLDLDSERDDFKEVYEVYGPAPGVTQEQLSGARLKYEMAPSSEEDACLDALARLTDGHVYCAAVRLADTVAVEPEEDIDRTRG